MHFYSPRAYEYVRTVYKEILLSVRTIRKWYESIDGKPGCTSEALVALQLRASAAAGVGKKLVCNLVMDEMFIRKEVQYDPFQKKNYGYVDFGNPFQNEEDERELAKEALVFLVNAVNDRFKIPVAYYFLNGVNASEKSNLVIEVLTFLFDAGVEISSITFDGAATNISTANKLGASFNINQLEPFFKHPLTNNVVPIFFDVCHMLKLIRNTLENRECIIDGDGKEIKWDFIKRLEYVHSRDGVLLANKLRKSHIDFKNQKMKTSLAAQTLSSSVAAGLSYFLKEGNIDFVGCEATIKFITIFDNLFDILNSKHKFSCRFKRPFCKNTYQEYLTFFDTAESYIRSLKVFRNGIEIEILKSQSKTGYLGFLIAISSFKMLYKKYVENDQIEYLLGFKFSQDHIETFFSAIRGRGGWNNNPNCLQFAAAYKKLLVRNEIKASCSANAIEDIDSPSLLSVSSASVLKSVEEKTACFLKSLEKEVESDDEVSLKEISSVRHDSVTYIAGFVEKGLRKQVKCISCIGGLNDLDTYAELSLISCKDWESNFGGLIKPKADIVHICQIAEKEVSMFEQENKLKKEYFYQDLMKKCFEKIHKTIFLSMYNNAEHKINCPYDSYYLIKYCLEKFIKIKLRHIAKKLNESKHPNKIRQKYNKLVLFSGQ